jgi:hypothetical protein
VGVVLDEWSWGAAPGAVGVIQLAFGRDQVELDGQAHPFSAFEQVFAPAGMCGAAI